MDLLSLAFYLSVLSYCLGLLLKALPLPFVSIKKIGRNLIGDGLFSATLVFSYNIIYRLVEYLGHVLGSNWVLFSYWLTDRISTLTNLLVIFKALGIVLERAGFRFIASNFIAPITNLIVSCYMTLLFILVITTILFTSFKILTALGLVLHAVPFRLTRSVGSTLLSIAIVFIVGIPLMPAFSSLVISGVQPPLKYTEPVCTATIKLVDAAGNPIGPAVIEGYDPRTGNLLYRYKFDEYGVLNIPGSFGFPCRDHVIKVDIVNNTYMANFRLSDGIINKTYQVTDSVSLASNRFMFVGPNVIVLDVEKLNGTIKVQLHAEGEGFIEIYVEDGDTLKVYLNNTTLTDFDKRTLEWYGVWYSTYKFSLNPGVYNLTIVLDFYKTTPINVLVEPFILKAVNVDVFSPEALFVYAIYSFVELVVLPIVYMVILVVISMGVAKLLGGYSSTIARLVAGRL